MARLHIHPVGLGLIFFGLLSWVVALGGLGVGTCHMQTHLASGDPSCPLAVLLGIPSLELRGQA